MLLRACALLVRAAACDTAVMSIVALFASVTDKGPTPRHVNDCGALWAGRLYVGSGERAARINMWTTLMLDFEGTNAVLFCRAEGNPRPTVTWIDPEDRHIDADSDQYLVRL